MLIKFQFSPKILEKYSNLTKIRQVEAELFHGNGGRHTDRQTDMTKIIVTFWWDSNQQSREASGGRPTP